MSSENKPNIPAALRPALEIFMRELDSHLTFFRQTVQQIAEQQAKEALSETYLGELRKLSNRFHTIKGSAGFFQLHAIKDQAASAEKLFLKDDTLQNEMMIKSELQEIILSFDSALNQIKRHLSTS